MVALDGQFHHDAEVTGYGLQGTGARRVFRSWELGVRRLWKRCAAECEMPDAGYGLQRDGESVEVFSDHGPRTTDQKFGNSDDLFIDQCSLIFERSAGANDIIFCGYRYDPETSFYYVRNRSYCPTLGRWLQRDPIGYAGGVNLYEYAGGRVVMDGDPFGYEGVPLGSLARVSPRGPGWCCAYTGAWRLKAGPFRPGLGILGGLWLIFYELNHPQLHLHLFHLAKSYQCECLMMCATSGQGKAGPGFPGVYGSWNATGREGNIPISPQAAWELAQLEEMLAGGRPTKREIRRAAAAIRNMVKHAEGRCGAHCQRLARGR